VRCRIGWVGWVDILFRSAFSCLVFTLGHVVERLINGTNITVNR
jgi:hypothetical protein